MHKVLITALASWLFFGCGATPLPPRQEMLVPNQEDLKAAILQHAKIMQKAFQEGNAEVYIPYVDPELVKLVGGKEDLKEKVFAKPPEMLKSLKSVEYGEVSDVLLEEGQYVAIFPIIMTFDLPDFRKVQKIFRVGISPDEGTSWYFIEGNGERNSNKFVESRFQVLGKYLELPECYTRKERK